MCQDFELYSEISYPPEDTLYPGGIDYSIPPDTFRGDTLYLDIGNGNNI